jgi:hypothetical protein
MSLNNPYLCESLWFTDGSDEIRNTGAAGRAHWTIHKGRFGSQWGSSCELKSG